MPKAFIFKWRPQGDSNPCRRRERPTESVFHPILQAFSVLESRREPSKAVKKAVGISSKHP